MKHFLYLGAGVLLAAAATSCVDDDYDLSDIDSTVRVQVNDLTVPVNIDPFTMESIFDIDPNDPDATVQVVDGVYAIVREGDFTTDEIKIGSLRLAADDFESAGTVLETGVSGQVPGGIDITVPFHTEEVSVSSESDAVPVEITEIDKIGATFTITYNLSFAGLENKVSKMSLRDVVINFPKGLTGTPNIGTYDPAKGELRIANVNLSTPRLSISMQCSELDFKVLGGVYDAAAHKAEFHTSVQIASGTLSFNSSDFTGNVPAQLTLKSDGRISAIDVTSFTGRITYNIDGADVSSVQLNDLPDVLSQKDTRIILENPQIYLSITNPVAQYGLAASTGLGITSVFKDENGTVTGTTYHSLDNGTFEVSALPSSAYCLAPTKPSSDPQGYENASFVPFHSLQTVLEGQGLPAELDIDLVNPSVFNQAVNHIPLGRSLGDVKGNYRFVAPLAFGAGSQLIYTDTEDGWNDEDVDKITIETLQVETTVSSQLPIEVNFTAYPIDIHGNRINNVSVEGATVPANASDHKLVIRITGEIQHLDGIVFTATATVPADMESPLNPSQSISCKDIRATVSGYYEKEL